MIVVWTVDSIIGVVLFAAAATGMVVAIACHFAAKLIRKLRR